MKLVIGRFGIELVSGEVLSLDEGGDSLSLRGITAYATPEEADVLRQQLLGYVGPSADDIFVPVLWGETRLKGFFRVKNASVSGVQGSASAGLWSFSVEVQRIRSATLIETLIVGRVRASEGLVYSNQFRNPLFAGSAAPVAEAAVGAVGIVTVSGTSFASGSASSAATASIRLSPNDKRPAAAPGEMWYADVAVRNANTFDRDFRVTMRFYDTVGATLGATTGSFDVDTPIGDPGIAGDPGVAVPVQGLAPAGTQSVGLIVSRLAGSGSEPGDLVRATQVYLSKDAPTVDISPVFFAGSTPNGGGRVHAWLGAANDSPSTRTVMWGGARALVAIPGAATTLEVANGNVSSTPPVVVVADSRGGTVKKYTVDSGTHTAQYQVAPDKFYEGAATLLAGDPLRTITGRNAQIEPESWLLTNGLLEVELSAGTFRYRTPGGAWNGFKVLGGPTMSALENAVEVAILQNTPAFVQLRLHIVSPLISGLELTEFPLTVDVGLSRGATFVTIETRSATAFAMGIAAEAFTSSSMRFDHGRYVDEAVPEVRFFSSPQWCPYQGTDADGFGIFGSVAARTAWSGGIGFTVKPDKYGAYGTNIPAFQAYRWAGSIRERAAAR